jgi:hypothetical protein
MNYEGDLKIKIIPMKKIILGISLSAIFFACKNSPDTPAENNKKSAGNLQETGTAVQKNASLDAIVTAYLQLKNALATDDGNRAASAAKDISDAMTKADTSTFTPEQAKVFNDAKADISEHAEHIGSNGSRIAHQREHFEMLSKDMYDLVKSLNSGQKLYLDHCPMYNEGKGASWLSETKEIKNPYLGKKMPGCGTVEEEIK